MKQPGLAFLIVLCTFSVAAASKFFYTLPQTETDVSGWSYTVADCQIIDDSLYSQFRTKKFCSETDKKVDVCKTQQVVELKDILTNEKRKFSLTYFIFGDAKSCQKNRQTYLNNSQAR